MAHRGSAHGFADSERRPRRRTVSLGRGRRRHRRARVRQQMDDDSTAARTLAATNGLGNIRATGEAVARRQHGGSRRSGVRPTGAGDPCHGAQPGWRGQHECACGHGSHACAPDDGCWAGTCASTWNLPEVLPDLELGLMRVPVRRNAIKSAPSWRPSRRPRPRYRARIQAGRARISSKTRRSRPQLVHPRS